MRLFIGIVPGKYAMAELTALLGRLRGTNARLTPVENIHMTLVFIGETREEDAHVVARCMERVDAGPARLALSGLGAFENKGIAWCGVEGELDKLGSIASALKAELSGAHVACDDKPFVPHITLARNIKISPLDLPVKPVAFTADELILFNSTRINGKLRYIPIHRKALK